MAARRSTHLSRFLRAAAARLDEAVVLRTQGYTLGGVYLVGYAVECGLKALILSQHAEHEQPGVIAGFRGTVSHDFDHLFHRYRAVSRLAWPVEVGQAVARLRVWGTDLRYTPSTRYAGDVGAVFDAALTVLAWLRGRL